MKKITLKTPYSLEEIPHDYHPTPNFKREYYVNLNGEWNFKVLKNDVAVYNGKILVPFPPESELSGVKHITKKGDLLVYEREFHINTHKRILLHFGAVDNECSVLINGNAVGENVGGYIPFAIDITDYVNQGSNTVTVLVSDGLSHTFPYGKQRHKRGGMWYTPISGIWQTVWLEYVPENYIKSLKTTPDLNSINIRIEGGCDEKTLILEGKEYTFTGNEISIELDNPRLWSPENPNIYEFTVLSGEDKISSYFALRTVEIKELGGKEYICLNGKPYFFHGILDQGYFPDGIFLPARAQVFKDDILKMKALGFNMLRKHIKIEPQIFYYYCDILGMAVFQDMVNNGSYSFIYDTALPTIGLKKLPRFEPEKVRREFYKTAENTVDLLYNHPCVVYYTIFNEGWGQHDPEKAYKTLKPLDTARIWDTASGWFKTGFTDVQSEHVYFKKADFKLDKKPAVLSEFGGYSCRIEGHIFNTQRVYGYKICQTQKDLTNDLEKLYFDEIIPLVKKGLNASVLTQLSDVEDEINGLITYDRRIIKPNPERMVNISKKLQEAFLEKTEKA